MAVTIALKRSRYQRDRKPAEDRVTHPETRGDSSGVVQRVASVRAERDIVLPYVIARRNYNFRR